ncbi:unnamed protein product [Zymoseptoria tritici ST99CH_3D1]|uniref:F-box domain-containing protein n=1 Tax=Zymoseptoria tritici ST99CH_1E4 TaxID=1276532 RepID=A0A2H1FN24_ZYMTR|nr:unnamed protein product [Zymoseptoria tritici ST99CH_1E4]SMR44905.1 unnamed protein product [Zymoseptoria tritici ST99CH_3D1]
MDSPSGETQEDSDFDFYSNHSSSDTAQASPRTDETAIAAPMAASDPLPQEDSADDSEAEMDMSPVQSPITSSHASPGTNGTSVAMDVAAVDATASPASHAGVKRKLSETESPDADPTGVPAEDENGARVLKLRKLDTPPAAHEDKSGSHRRITELPFSIWKQVFMHLSPAMLARCVRVSKTFRSWLVLQDGEVIANPAAAEDGNLRTFFPDMLARLSHPSGKIKAYLNLQEKKLNAGPTKKDIDTVWTNSKRTFYNALPKSLQGMTDMQMLALIGGSSCQSCGKVGAPSTANSVFNAGPGPDGVRVIWPFRIRSCGSCLEQNVVRDIQVLQNPTLSALRFGVAHGFFRSTDLHFVPDQVRQLPGGIPGNLKFSKVYHREDLRKIVDDETHAKTLGEAALDEWRKGLLDAGKKIMNDSARWEKWELQMRPGIDLGQMLREDDPSSFPRRYGTTQSKPAGSNGLQPPLAGNGTHPLPQPVHVFENGFNSHFEPPGQQQPQPLEQQRWQQSRKVRDPREVSAARSFRKLEIERRCREMETPIAPEFLQHMDSFNAALKISLPLTDGAWEMLKPRLLSQLPHAQEIEYRRTQQQSYLQAGLQMEPNISKPAREVYDRDYDQLQEPLRKKLAEYASDIINGRWHGGNILEPNNVPEFAADVLVFVHEMYNANENEAGSPSSTNLADEKRPFLSLDNMKWLYDNKVRPLTESQRREQFICEGCFRDGTFDDKKPKWFAFEGLIQHYGAKHTSDFSKGNVVVHWQTAHWPEEQMFHKEPGRWLQASRRPADFKPKVEARPTPPESARNSYALPPQQSLEHSRTGSTFQQMPHEYPYSHQVPPVTEAQVGRQVLTEKLACDAREVWDALDGVKGIQALGCIRLQTAIHHCVSRYAQAFHDLPTLDIFSHALVNQAQMKPLRKAHLLVCKTCLHTATNGAPDTGEYWYRTSQAPKYTALELIEHYQKEHKSAAANGVLNWVKDMIELPDRDEIRTLLHTPGMDDAKLGLIAAALPHAFPLPLPKIGVVADAADKHERRGNGSKHSGKGKHAQGQKKQKNGKGGGKRRPSHDSPLPEPNENEYDPRRPMYVSVKNEAPDPAQFDTDARKPADPSMFDTDARYPPRAAPGPVEPETLAAVLQRLVPGPSAPQQPSNGDRQSRSPSVGRREPEQAPRPTASAINPVTQTQPDFSAILASLTSQGAVTPTSMTAPAPRQRSVSTAHRSAPGAYSEHPYDGARRSVHQYEAPYQAPLQPHLAHGVHELQAALTGNRRQFEHNQQVPAQQYRIQYEGDHYHGRPQPQQVYYNEAPVHYMPRRESEQSYAGYQQQASAPHTIFVDQQGRQLEPVPTTAPVQYAPGPSPYLSPAVQYAPVHYAPAPMQYAPSPYDQQQYDRRHEQAVYAQPVYDDGRQMYYPPPSAHHPRQ